MAALHSSYLQEWQLRAFQGFSRGEVNAKAPELPTCSKRFGHSELVEDSTELSGIMANHNAAALEDFDRASACPAMTDADDDRRISKACLRPAILRHSVHLFRDHNK